MADQKGRVAKAKKAHEQANKERADEANALRISFKNIKDEPAFQHTLYMLQHLADLHTRVAKDGGGYRDTGRRDISGNAEQELVFFTPEKRMSELDQASGLEEGLAWMQRQITDDALKPIVPKKVVV